LQIRFDLRALGAIEAADPEGYAGSRPPGEGPGG
jgi:hypothetical protein